MSRIVSIVAVALLLLVVSCHKPPAPPATPPAAKSNPPAAASVPPNDYSRPVTWLCLPGRDDYCNIDLTTTIISADGSMTMEPWAPDPNAKIDCFYVYPTVSGDKSGNSDMIPGPGEIDVVKVEFARFAEVCRPFAPLYRQVTLTALKAHMAGKKSPKGDANLAYNDVKDAWHYYLAHYNHGRGVVLIGHSQGAGILTKLISNEIDGKPVQKLLVSAILAGTRLPVPKGKLVGGAFQHIPLCTANDETGCVITYASFRANMPPSPTARFGHVSEPGMIAACTNPAALGGGSGDLHAYLSTKGPSLSDEVQKPWVASDKAVTTPFVSLPGMLTAQCIDDEHGSWLAVTVHGDPTDPRVDDIVGDVVEGGRVQADWGLHLIDLNLAMGNLIDIVGAEAAAFSKTAGSTPPTAEAP